MLSIIAGEPTPRVPDEHIFRELRLSTRDFLKTALPPPHSPSWFLPPTPWKGATSPGGSIFGGSMSKTFPLLHAEKKAAKRPKPTRCPPTPHAVPTFKKSLASTFPW